MKSGDMLLQAECVSKYFNKKKVIFIGDGDAISVCMIYLYKRGLLKYSPSEVRVLDFDERVIYSIKQFAKAHGLTKELDAELYNVADKIDKRHWRDFEAFYTNPPFGASNNGKSIEAFIHRGIEAVTKDGLGVIVLADHIDYPWTQNVLSSIQKYILKNGFMVSELMPNCHHYHLEDAPNLTSCNLMIRRVNFKHKSYSSKQLEKLHLENFYGSDNPLKVKYVRDLTVAGKLVSRDHYLESF